MRSSRDKVRQEKNKGGTNICSDVQREAETLAHCLYDLPVHPCKRGIPLSRPYSSKQLLHASRTGYRHLVYGCNTKLKIVAVC